MTTDPENEELHKLKTDLEEVIQLTCELIKTQILEEQKLLKGKVSYLFIHSIKTIYKHVHSGPSSDGMLIYRVHKVTYLVIQ